MVPGLAVEEGRDGGHAHGDSVLVPEGHEEEALHNGEADDVASGALVAQQSPLRVGPLWVDVEGQGEVLRMKSPQRLYITTGKVKASKRSLERKEQKQIITS